MACLGVHFALTEEEVSGLRGIETDAGRLEHLQEELEATYFGDQAEFKAETDKAWDAMHRLLGDGELSFTSGPDPLRLTVIGGEPLYRQPPQED